MFNQAFIAPCASCHTVAEVSTETCLCAPCKYKLVWGEVDVVEDFRRSEAEYFAKVRERITLTSQPRRQ